MGGFWKLVLNKPADRPLIERDGLLDHLLQITGIQTRIAA